MESFDNLIEREIPRLRRYARALTRDVTAADDLVQDCLVRALAKKHLWQPDTDLRAWLFTILHNQYVNQVRKIVREGIIAEVSEFLQNHDRTDGSLGISEIEVAMNLLPADFREAIELVGLEGLPYEYAAIVLGIPVGTVRSRLSRGRELLKLLLDGTSVGDPEHTGKTLRSVAKERAQRRMRVA